jgi:hypothetical protein
MFQSFFEQTSLHGWAYLAKDAGEKTDRTLGPFCLRRLLWSIVLAASIVASIYLVYNNVQEFTR